MALVVETGAALSNADAYVSTAFVDDYVSKYTESSTWSDASTTSAMKERAIRQATQFIDAQYGDRFSGERVLETQALCWPRYSARTSDEICIDSDEIPVDLQRACAELAIRALSGTLLSDETAGTSGIQEETIKVGPIMETTKFVGSNTSSSFYALPDRLLSRLCDGNGTLERG